MKMNVRIKVFRQSIMMHRQYSWQTFRQLLRPTPIARAPRVFRSVDRSGLFCGTVWERMATALQRIRGGQEFYSQGPLFMAAEVAGATNPHNVFLAHAHRRLSLILLTPDSSAFTALCSRKI